ncbi:MAG TPA: methyltransferase domain-containing protein [Opitutaceae bacterium]|nr:methyltransferase domain-containing protein [Opitutaceae bacterium]
MSNFSTIAPAYERGAVVQRHAAARLFELVAIGPTDDVLDLGCGPGHLTRQIRGMTGGKVSGWDVSPGMIAQARQSSPDLNVDFRVGAGEVLDEPECFDVVFCNSTFQWFRDPSRVLANCRRSLRRGGRLGVQAPAGRNYCPVFTRATAALMTDTSTAETYRRFQSPWFFLDTAGAYADLCRATGLEVRFSHLEPTVERCTPEEVMQRFDSGAAAGYLNPECYRGGCTSGYLAAARGRIAATVHSLAEADGLVALVFHRLYLLAVKP